MGQKDTLSKNCFKDNRRFADLINAYCFHGEPLISPDDIQDCDSSVQTASPSKKGSLLLREGFQDITRKIVCKTQVILASLEAQTRVDYGMPVRVLGYDAGRYREQMIAKRNLHLEHKEFTRHDFLSFLTKTDRLSPVITIVLYFNGRWDGARSLKELLALEGIPQPLQNMTGDYPINMLEVDHYPHLDYFQTDLRLIFGFLQNSKDKDALRTFVERNQEGFRTLSADAFDLISEMAHAEDLKRIRELRFPGKEEVDMCKAIDDMVQLAKMQGMKRGEKRGLKRGKDLGAAEERSATIRLLVRDYLEDGYSEEMICRKLNKLFALDRRAVKKYLK